jgi:hypothetical protein
MNSTLEGRIQRMENRREELALAADLLHQV